YLFQAEDGIRYRNGLEFRRVLFRSRYAAAENATVATRARTMSIVIWATTVGSVIGPNLIDPGDRLGGALGLPNYAGTYILSVVEIGRASCRERAERSVASECVSGEG